MISSQYQCIFIHIPKSAGQSIEHLFLKLHGLTWKSRSQLLLRENKIPDMGPSRLAHRYANEYIKHGYVNQENYEKYYKFSFVRNPWSRLVSEYKYRNHQNKFSFKEFVLHNLPEQGMSDEYRHIVPQYDFLYSDNGHLMVNFIGKFETLQEDFNIVAKNLNLPIANLPIANLPHINKSHQSGVKGRLHKIITQLKSTNKPSSSNYREYYSDDLRKTVSKMYEKDIDIFKYTF